jgi:hypothetical protein
MRRLLAVLTALVLLPAAAAIAAPFDDVFADYQKDGRIDPCAHSAEELEQAREAIPNDIDQYAPEFPGRLDTAIREREQGACGGATTTTPTTAAPPGETGAGGTPAPAPGAATPSTPGQTPSPPGTAQPADPAKDGAIADAAARQADDGGDVPAPLLALLVLAALLALCALVWALFRLFAWEPRWLLGARHAIAEAGWRTGGAWADFTDWLRSRRSTA